MMIVVACLCECGCVLYLHQNRSTEMRFGWILRHTCIRNFLLCRVFGPTVPPRPPSYNVHITIVHYTASNVSAFYILGAPRTPPNIHAAHSYFERRKLRMRELHAIHECKIKLIGFDSTFLRSLAKFSARYTFRFTWFEAHVHHPFAFHIYIDIAKMVCIEVK